MAVLTFTLSGLSLLLLGAHFLRVGEIGLAASLLGLSLLLLTRQAWVRLVTALVLAAGAVLWVQAGGDFISARAALGQPWLRLLCIMAGVLVLDLAGLALVWRGREVFSREVETARPQAVAFVLSAALLAVARAEAPIPLLLADRFFPGWGTFEIFLLATYAAWLAGRMLPARGARVWRPRLWAGFSAVFFAQLALGLLGVERLLMTGALHLPVPALIVAGPLYRGAGYFMLILFAVSVLLVGPAWCSHLCYIGAWDDLSRRAARKASPFPTWALKIRWLSLALVVLAALGLRFSGLPASVAVVSAALFGLAGVAVMLLLSRRFGRMIHCTAYCPMGLLADLLGRLTPWRLRIGPGCDGCGSCSRVCPYGALSPADLARGRPGLSCTLCGDCLPACARRRIGYRLPGLSPERSRSAFLVLVMALHAVFLGVARM